MTDVVESVLGDSHDDSHIIMIHLLGESLDVLDDGGLRQLTETVPVEFGTGLVEERSTGDVRGVTTGQFTENVTFLEVAADLKSGHRIWTQSKNAVHVSGKTKTFGSEVELGNVLHLKIVAFDFGDRSDEESMALRTGIGRVNAGKSCLSSDYPEKRLTEFGLSELKIMARTKAEE